MSSVVEAWRDFCRVGATAHPNVALRSFIYELRQKCIKDSCHPYRVLNTSCTKIFLVQEVEYGICIELRAGISANPTFDEWVYRNLHLNDFPKP